MFVSMLLDLIHGLVVEADAFDVSSACVVAVRRFRRFRWHFCFVEPAVSSSLLLRTSSQT